MSFPIAHNNDQNDSVNRSVSLPISQLVGNQVIPDPHGLGWPGMDP